MATKEEGQRVVIIGDKPYQEYVKNSILELTKLSPVGQYLLENALSSSKSLIIANTEFVNVNSNFVNDWEEDYTVFSLNLDLAVDSLENSGGMNGNVTLSQSIFSHLAHELSHFNNDYKPGAKLVDHNGYQTEIYADEPFAVRCENRMRKDSNLELRTHYGGMCVLEREVIPIDSSYLYFRLEKIMGDSSHYYDQNFSNIDSVNRTKQLNFAYEGRKNYYLSGKYLNTYLKKPVSSEQLIITYHD